VSAYWSDRSVANDVTKCVDQAWLWCPRYLSKKGNVSRLRAFDVNRACISLWDAGPGQLLHSCNTAWLPPTFWRDLIE
jgi:hypothetical protein